MPRKVALIYGFGEGAWHGKQFKKRLQSADFELVSDVAAADIVIAHSAGSFYVPELQGHQTIMFIGPPYWPGRNVLAQMGRKVWVDFRLNSLRHPLYLLQKTSWNIFYIFRDFRRSQEISLLGKTFDLPAAIKHHKTIIIRNADDTWLTPDLQPLQQAYPTLQVHHVPGDHDDCWLHPDIYINLLQSDV